MCIKKKEYKISEMPLYFLIFFFFSLTDLKTSPLSLSPYGKRLRIRCCQMGNNGIASFSEGELESLQD